MFSNCPSLQKIDAANWDVSNVTNMQRLFADCAALQTLDIKNWNVSKVKTMLGMFSSCANIATPDLSGWDVSKITLLGEMFADCSSLATLNLSGWHIPAGSCIQAPDMFRGCTALKEVIMAGCDDHTIDFIAARLAEASLRGVDILF